MTRWWGGGTALLVAALLAAACTEKIVLEHPVGSGGGGGTIGLGGGGNGGSNIGDGGISDASPDNHLHCTGSTTLTQIMSSQSPPSIMFAVDRSPSMARVFGAGGGGGSNGNLKYAVTKSAIQDTVGNYFEVAQFGYVEFPGSGGDPSCNGCCAGALQTPIAKDTSGAASAIGSIMNQCWNPSSNEFNCVNSSETPTAQALSKVASTLKRQQFGPLYAVLITDGHPTCADPSSVDSACEQTAQLLSSMSNSASPTPILTAVVGIGDLSTDDAACLISLANAGGYAAGTGYVAATTEAALRSQIDSVVAGTICRVDITELNFDTTRPIEVDFNNVPIPPDPNKINGWDLDKNTNRITIYGLGANQACTTLIQELKSTSHHVTVKSCVDPHATFPSRP